MNNLTLGPAAPLRGSLRVPGDKSISHRALLLGALADGSSHVSGFLPAGDCLATLACLRALGVEITVHDPTTLTIHGRGLRGLRRPSAPLDCARSGTSMRLLAGILAGQSFESVLSGAPQLLRRPMQRVADPLRLMGAEIADDEGCAPLRIRGRQLCGIDYALPVASAQVKSALLLAGLYASGPTTVRQPGPARDHTERMLASMGANVETNGLDVTLYPGGSLAALALDVPGDFSSAAFMLAAAALVPGSELTLPGVGVNPTRTGLLDVLGAMGARIKLDNRRQQGGEPVADVTLAWTPDLRSVEVSGSTVVRMIDEFPALAVVATQAHGDTIVRDAAELRVKETDRIATVVAELQALGAHIEPRPDGFVVHGPTPLNGAQVQSHGDHRLAMALSIAALVASGQTTVQDTACIADSFPGFTTTVKRKE